jgi:hypothetical protein
MEIVGREPALMYESDADAVAKIARTLADTGEQQRLRQILSGIAGQFSTPTFMRQVRDIVAEFEP